MTSYYNLTINFEISVCLCVCLSVCPAIRFHSSQRIFSKSGGEPSTGHDTFRGLYICARVFVHSLIFERIMSKFAGNILRLTISGKYYVLFIVTHRVYACKRASASACVSTPSLIYGWILFKFALNILQVTSSSMGNVLFMFTHRAHACERACATERVFKDSLIYGPTLFKFAVNILQLTTSRMGYVLVMITHRAHAYECVRALGKSIHSSLDGFSSNVLGTYYRWATWATHLSSRTAVTRASVRVRARA
jgi:hypothetical protein